MDIMRKIMFFLNSKKCKPILVNTYNKSMSLKMSIILLKDCKRAKTVLLCRFGTGQKN